MSINNCASLFSFFLPQIISDYFYIYSHVSFPQISFVVGEEIITKESNMDASKIKEFPSESCNKGLGERRVMPSLVVKVG